MSIHETKTITIHGEECEIDCEIVPLIEYLNEPPGLQTINSCQGDKEASWKYVVGGTLQVHSFPYFTFKLDENNELQKQHTILDQIVKACEKVVKNTKTEYEMPMTFEKKYRFYKNDKKRHRQYSEDDMEIIYLVRAHIAEDMQLFFEYLKEQE
jgi:hypothetical protein